MKVNIIVEEKLNERIDKYLANKLNISRSLISRSIGKKKILVNDRIIKPSYLICEGDLITGELIDDSIVLEPMKIDLDIVYEDEYIIVVNKPYNLVVHPSPSNKSGTLVNALLNYTDKLSDLGGEDRPGIIHRLDKDTTGLLIIAKDNMTHNLFKDLFKKRKIQKKYLAIVHGIPKPINGILTGPIGRSPKNRTKMEINGLNSREALTEYKTATFNEEYSCLEVLLHTGRTHQIRVHLASNGTPIVGDIVYGRKKEKIKVEHQLLHSYGINFMHPITKDEIKLTAKPDSCFIEFLEKTKLRYNYDF